MTQPADASRIRWLLLDADGTLTDGGMFVHGHGSELKRFSVRDGFGLRAWLSTGREVAVITGRGDLSLRHRLADLGIQRVVSASGPKGEVVDRLLADQGVDRSSVAAMGDDIPDLPMLRRAAYPMAVADAAPEVKALARWVSASAGGHGAVREAVEHLLRAAGEWQGVVERHA
jgi:3-deoxy-D-manno-octulosonate 8-phosphate phosphatase (KDO 8-P phosphatase)